jgi:hypothetical protein
MGYFYLEIPGTGPRGSSGAWIRDMLGRYLDTGIFLHGSPFPSDSNLVCAGENRILGTLLNS